MNSKVLIILIVSLIAITLAQVKKLSKDEEREIVNEYFKTRRDGRNKRKEGNKEHDNNVIKRYYDVQEHNERFNNGEEDFEAALNDLSELNDEEIAANYLGYKEPEDAVIPEESKVPVLNETRAGRDALPASWNWADHGSVVQPVQNQGGCGSCYVSLGTILTKEFYF